MKTKSNVALGQLHLKADATLKQAGRDVMIEGLSNAAVIDRGNDFVETTAFDGKGLENFKKNPILFFNHNTDLPIGKVLDIMPTEKGLFVRAKISNSKDEFTTRIRELVKEGILKTFSIGFDSRDDEKDAEGINRIKSAELFEVSVVGIPMNQDSTFSVIQKSAKSKAEMKRLMIEELAKIKTTTEATTDTTTTTEKPNTETASETPTTENKDVVELTVFEKLDNLFKAHEGPIAEEDVHQYVKESGEIIPKEDWPKVFALADKYKSNEETVPMMVGKNDDDFGSPHLELAKQTNVLLGALINRIDGVIEAVNELKGRPEPDSTEEVDLSKEQQTQEQSNNTEEPTEGERLSDEAEKGRMVEEENNSEETLEEKMLSTKNKKLANRLKKLGF